MRNPHLPLVLIAACACTGAGAAELGSAALKLDVRPGGSGFVDGLVFKGRTVCRAPEGFAGATLAIVGPAQGSDVSALFAAAPARVLTARVERASVGAGALWAAGRYVGGDAPDVPFERRFTLGPDGGTLRLEETTDLSGLPAGWRVAHHALHLPLAVTNDLHLRMFGIGCAGRAELFRMDMNDLSRRNQLISAPRGHWPYWDLAGVTQWPGSYRVWTSNHADTPAYPLQEGPGAPGWIDYSEYDWGITVRIPEPARSAPWSAFVDARRGVLTLEPWPAGQPAFAHADARRRFVAELLPHETSWPATAPCELDFATYRALLADIGDYIHSAVGTSDADAILFRERLQPSTVLRLLYRGDAWRMGGRMAAAGIQVPRNQPMDKWEEVAARYLDHVRANGVPAKKPR